jgi:hypothetical protein
MSGEQVLQLIIDRQDALAQSIAALTGYLMGLMREMGAPDVFVEQMRNGVVTPLAAFDVILEASQILRDEGDDITSQ